MFRYLVWFKFIKFSVLKLSDWETVCFLKPLVMQLWDPRHLNSSSRVHQIYFCLKEKIKEKTILLRIAFISKISDPNLKERNLCFHFMWFFLNFANFKFLIFSNREKGCQTNMRRPTWSVSAMQHSSLRNASAVQGRRSYPNLKSPKSEPKEKFENIFNDC